MKNRNELIRKLINIWCIIFVSLFVFFLLHFVFRKDNNLDVLTVSDEEQVIFRLNGKKNMSLILGDDFIDPGFVVESNIDGDVSAYVSVQGEVNNVVLGEYKITYTLDYKGLTVDKIRVVKVVNEDSTVSEDNGNIQTGDFNGNGSTDTTGNVSIALNGYSNVYLLKGTSYNDLGAKAITKSGNDVSNTIKTTGSVDVNKAGTYTIKYAVSDSKGKTARVSRTIKILDMSITITPSIKSYTNQDILLNIVTNTDMFSHMVMPNGEMVNSNSYNYQISTNGEYKFIVYNSLGLARAYTYTVKNIDKEAPTGSCCGYYKGGKSYITINSNDNIGVLKYVLNNKAYKDNSIIVDSVITNPSITMYDKVGNTNNISCTLEDKSTYFNSDFSVQYFDSKSGNGMSYWLYIPDGATDNMPMIIYLHGSGGKGNDYVNNTRLAIQNGPGSDIYYKRRDYNAIMLMPQVRANSYLNMDELMELIDYVANTYKVNKNKISLSGMSEGANQISVKVGNRASYFSSIVLLGNYVSNPENFVSVPVVTMCGELDYGRNSSMKKFVNKINELGGNAKHYTVEGLEHNIVGSKYSVFRDGDFDLVSWMLRQEKK